ncbi:MAG: calcium-binding protein, partial [Hyphomicrobiales bacterium]|nr:calcium-binding protein [Hyphomicrobiales bacterium]
ANSISIVPTWYVSNAAASDFTAGATMGTDAELLKSIADAQAQGLSVMLKPHVDSLDGIYRGDLAPADVAAWFAGYKDMIVHYAAMAEAGGVSSLSIGCELQSLTGAQYQSYWQDIIATVRGVYHGELTYAADWAEAAHVSFWADVDVIGVNPYIPLATTTTPTLQDLVDAWHSVPADMDVAHALNNLSPIDFLHSLSVAYDKPLMLTEVGYRSVDGAAMSPGDWSATGVVDEAEQAMLYDALFQVFSERGGDWFRGVELWNWEPTTNPDQPTGFTPQGKEALQVISDWFNGVRTGSGFAQQGSGSANVMDGGLYADQLSGGAGDDLIRGGDGDDLLIGGPDHVTTLQTTSISVVAQADVLNGVGAQFRLLVNGVQVGAVQEAGATASSFTFSFANIGPVNSMAIEFLNDAQANGGDRNLHVRSMDVNGNALDLATAQNPSGNPDGTMWFNSQLYFVTSDKQDLFVGAMTDNDALMGGAGDDVLRGGAGDDLLDGGDGYDTAVFSGARADYTLARNADGSITITDSRAGSPDGVDIAKWIEDFQFSDGVIHTADIAAPIALSMTADASGLTRQTSINLNLGVIADARVEAIAIYDSGTFLGNGALNSSGQWVFNAANLSDGAHAFTAVALTQSGVQIGATSTSSSVIVDSLAPIVSATESVSGLTKLGTTVIKAIASDTSGVTSVHVFDQGRDLGLATQASDGSWTFTATNLADGTHNFTVSATDAAGNVTGAVSAGPTLIVDRTAPVTSITNAIVKQGVTTISGQSEANSLVTLYDGNKIVAQNIQSDVNGAWTYASAALSTTAKHVFTASATDLAGNTGVQGNHLVLGTTGKDSLSDSSSDVVFIGGSGNDSMNGGGGGDTFIFQSGFGVDKISGFAAATTLSRDHDVLAFDHTIAALAGVHTDAELATYILSHTRDVNGSAVITFDSLNSITLSDVTKAQLTMVDFHLI